MKRWIKWISLVVATCAVLVLAVCIISPNWRLVAGMFVSHLLANKSPPPIAEGIVLRDVYLDAGKSDAALTGVLERRFGPGTNEATLQSVLLAQGFKPLPPPPSNCLPLGQSAPIGTIYVSCYNTKNILRYEWSGFTCLKTITVTWRTNDRSEIAEVKGSYHSACL